MVHYCVLAVSDLCPLRNGHVRLNPQHIHSDSLNRAGRVEVCVDEEWHSLCARMDGISTWDSHAAEVFCKEWTAGNRIASASE